MRLAYNMSLEEQAKLLNRDVPDCDKRTLDAINADGLVWIDQKTGEKFAVLDTKQVIKL
jgi:predicted transcriptional regulator